MVNTPTQIIENNPSNKKSQEVLTTYPGDLYIKNAHKAFGVTKALDGVSFTGYFGEIHAVIGGNGCGKSTLAKVLAGVLPIDSGKVSIRGHHPSTPSESRAIGVSMVFQEVLVADESSVVDNLFVGSDGFFSKSMSDRDKQEKARAMMTELAGEPVDPMVPAGTLPLSIKAWITIARGLLCEPDVLILDESSAALDFDSTERLFDKIRELRDGGSAIIIVTHRIAELIRISDRCTVMRDGKDVGVLEKEQITEENLLRLMTGRAESAKPVVGDAHQTTSTESALRIRNMKVWPDSDAIDFDLLKGEIVGFTGLDGHGQDDFVRILAGVKNASEGYTYVSTDHGQGFAAIKSLEDAKSYDIGFVSGDRKREGILPNLSIFENLLMPLYRSYSKLPGLRLINWLDLQDIFDWEVDRLAIKTGPKDNLITSLSGGNQQKVMLGRAFAQHPTTLVLLDPARGIDLHTKRDLYKQLREFADEGNSVIYMSSELEEFIGFCSRVLVFRNGSIFDTFRNETIEAVGMLESMFGRTQGGESKPTSSSNKTAKTSNKPNKQQTQSPSANPIDDSRSEQVELNVSKYNVSKYFNTETHQVPVTQTVMDSGYNSNDEVLFDKILDTTTHYRHALSQDNVAENTQKQNTSTVEYSPRDKQQFDSLMNFKTRHNSPIDKHENGFASYNMTDEKTFKKLMSSKKNDTQTTNLTSAKKEPAAKSITEVNLHPNNIEYSAQDLQKFKRLMGD
mgnify:CR=1 FL=1